LAPYTGGTKNVYKCPADKMISPQQRGLGWTERVRSISMNSCMGEGNDKNWYGDDHTIFEKLTHFGRMSPSKAWVFVDEHPDSINDPCSFVNVREWQWVDLPASYHNGACGFAFADGHSEIKKWLEPTTLRSTKFQDFSRTTVQVGDRDLAWVVEHTSVPRLDN